MRGHDIMERHGSVGGRRHPDKTQACAPPGRSARAVQLRDIMVDR